MRIEVRRSNVSPSEALDAHVCRKIELATRRFVDRIECVVVRLTDVNGPKGGRDKRCRIAARLWTSGPSIVVEAMDGDVYVAVSQAAARLHDAMARTVERAARGSQPGLPSTRRDQRIGAYRVT